ncbi:MAG TPA: histidine phosphatase family protein [Paracoccaceae bacterium]|nr:histidine phosphatase family protein [Paracoccaceae bacterium]
MRRLLLVRHGPTHAKGMTGWTDLPADLSDTAALSRLAAALPPAAAVVSSDLIRAIATADAIQGHRPRLPHDPRLREIHFGAWESRLPGDIAQEHPDLSRAFWDGAPGARPPGGESFDDLAARIGPATDAALSAHPGDLVIVAHFGVVLAALARAAGWTTVQSLAHRIEPLSLSEIEITATGWSVTRINHRP